jgi:hypothetical protein
MIRHAVLGLVAVLALGAAVSGEEKVKKLSAADYAEIQQLYVQYARSIDTKGDKGMDYARTFAPDGELFHAHSGKTYRGHHQIATESMGQVTTPSAWPTHYNANLRIEPTPEGARGYVYLLLTRGSANGPPAVTGVGTYRDTLVKTKEGWRFKRRELYLNTMPPAEAAPAAK